LPVDVEVLEDDALGVAEDLAVGVGAALDADEAVGDAAGALADAVTGAFDAVGLDALRVGELLEDGAVGLERCRWSYRRCVRPWCRFE
jgi:hypothetical protein